MKKLTETQAEILKQLNRLNTYPGFFGSISCFGILLALIGVLCPFFSYNPTVADDLKRTVSLFHLSSVALVVAIVGLLFLIIAICIRAFQFFDAHKVSAGSREKNNR